MRPVPAFTRSTGARLLLLGLCLSLAPAAAGADSLFVPGKSRSMFADRRARMAGDLVTVLITESTTAVQDADMELKRQTEIRADGGSGLFGILKLVPKAGVTGGASQEGSGSTTRTSRVLSSITCRVTQVEPNGQLVLSGERHLRVNGDLQTIRLTGTVRPDDVGRDNTVASSAIADARIEIIGKGPINRAARPSLLWRIIQFLF